MNAARGLSAEHLETLARDGVVTLKAAVPRVDALAMADHLWTDLERRCGLDRARPQTWTTERPAQFQAVERTGVFAPSASPIVRAAIDQLLGAGGWDEPRHWGQPLVTFPSPGVWDVPHQAWHLDTVASAQPPAVARFFTFLAPAEPGGGGTLYVAGSHRLIQGLAARETDSTTISSGAMRRRLAAEHPWLADLWASATPDRVQRFMHDGAQIDGIELRVREMTGEPGDVIFMHPQVLHAFAPNNRATPRMMLTQWIYGRT